MVLVIARVAITSLALLVVGALGLYVFDRCTVLDVLHPGEHRLVAIFERPQSVVLVGTYSGLGRCESERKAIAPEMSEAQLFCIQHGSSS